MASDNGEERLSAIYVVRNPDKLRYLNKCHSLEPALLTYCGDTPAPARLRPIARSERQPMRTLLLGLAALVLPATALAQEVPLGRLPDTATPVAYRLDLTIDPEQPRFSGHTEIDIEEIGRAHV